MNREQLDTRHTAVIRRHARGLGDSDGAPPRALLDELAQITEQYATEHAERVIARRELRAEAAAPPLVAADPAATAPTPSPSSVARTRTRTRRSAT